MKKVAVIGDPISQSLSPLIHNFWLKKYDIEGSYEAIKITSEDLENSLLSLVKNGYSGFNVTIPHKEKVGEFFWNNHNFFQQEFEIEMSNIVNATKAVNTVVINKNIIELHNSDGYGFFENLQNTHQIDLHEKNIFIIGCGGAARSVLYECLSAKKIYITNRTKEKFDKLLQNSASGYFANKIIFLEKNQFEENLSNCDLLVNTSSLGMIGQEPLQINLAALKKSAIVYDIVYKPLMTELLKNAQNRGNKIVTGIGMLAFQAALGFEKWFGKKPEIDDELIELLLLQ